MILSQGLLSRDAVLAAVAEEFLSDLLPRASGRTPPPQPASSKATPETHASGSNGEAATA